MEDSEKQIKHLIEMAAKIKDPDGAMRYSQAACNAANALHTLYSLRKPPLQK